MIHRLYQTLFLGALISTTAFDANAELGVASLFSDHAVLQRDMPVPIWGSADAGEEVTVAFREQTKSTKADKDGKWRLKLDALETGGPDELSISCGDEKIAIADVLVGEVWVGSGQSNMAGGAGGYAKRDATLAKLLEAAPYPKIRLMKGGAKPIWQEADAKSAPGFSAILLAYGESLHRELDVPVGLIVGAVGGTPSGAWLSQAAYDSSDACKKSLAEFSNKFDADGAQKAYEAKLAAWEKRVAEAQAKGEKPKGRKPSPPAKPGQMTRGGVGNLYEKFIRSVVGYGIRGVLWDQGESGTAIIGVDQYSVMDALISGWRKEWGQGEFPFIYVQKPSGGGPASSPKGENQITREADPYQPPPASVPKVGDGARRLEFIRIMDIPNAHMVSAADLGSSVHPTNKWGYGNRAARVAFAKVYGKDLLSHGPRYKSHKLEGDKIRIEFSNVGGGLAQVGGEALTGFAIAGEDKNFVWADAVIDGEDVVLSAEAVSKPVAVRFACSKKRNWANLFNKDGLPALAFRTDKW
ncbi:MAG: sialate O-acetylesterase [Verrucomicrobiales bacterium]|jgi:sialate O-acetylesterase